jgi:hypothetical protein
VLWCLAKTDSTRRDEEGQMKAHPSNYCYDSCPHNTIDRSFWQEEIEKGKPKQHSSAADGRQKKLKCSLGYTQTVNSPKALSNSIKNSSKICSDLRKLFSGNVTS